MAIQKSLVLGEHGLIILPASLRKTPRVHWTVWGPYQLWGCAVTNLALPRPAMFGEISDIARERGCPVCRRALRSVPAAEDAPLRHIGWRLPMR